MREVQREQWSVELNPDPVWRHVGVYVSFIPDVDDPWPLEQIKDMRSFDPRLVPAMRYKVYRAPTGSLHVFKHHGVVLYDPEEAEPDAELAGALRPFSGYLSRFPGNKRPNHVERWFEPTRDWVVRGSVRHKYGLPMWTVPWGSWVPRWARETGWAARAEEKRLYCKEQEEQAPAAVAYRDATAEAEYIAPQEAKWRAQHHATLADVTPDDEREQLAKQRGEVEEEKTPFVHVGKGAAA